MLFHMSFWIALAAIPLIGCDATSRHCPDLASTFESSGLQLTVLGSSTLDDGDEFESFSRSGDIDPDSVFEIASMTKAVTATAVMQLVEAGRIDLDAPVSSYLPELDEIDILQEDLTRRKGTVPVTMRHLLTHTAGFGYFFNSPLISLDIGRDPKSMEWPTPEVVAADEYDWGFGGLQPRRIFEAGERWHYGRNLGIAGRVVERISGMDLDTYFRTHIFQPLHMDRTGYNLPDEIRADMVPMMMRNPNTGDLIPIPSMREIPMERFYGGGDLLSTPRDYLRFLTCLTRGGELDGVRILSESSVDTFFESQLSEGTSIEYLQDDPMRRKPGAPERCFLDDQDQFSFAWAIEANPNDRGNRPRGVGYWSGIFNTYYTVDRERGIAVVGFSQLLPFNDAQAYELYRLYEDCVFDGR